MGTRICCAVVLSLVASAGWAQDGLRSASLPERTPMAPLPPPGSDLFRAGPETYTPHADRRWFVATYVPSVYWPGTDASPATWRRPPAEPSADRPRIALPVEFPKPAEPATPAAPPAAVPGDPRTFYVIPGCYAGDRPPRPERLPAGCDAASMRVIPPRPG